MQKTSPATSNATLAELPVGTRISITGFTENGGYTAQLRRLGLVTGTEVTLVRRAPLGDPLELRLRGYSLALRPAEAAGLQFEIIA